MSKSMQFISDSEEVRLDQFLHAHIPGYSRSYFQYLIDKCKVRVNGKCEKKRHLVKKGDVIDLSLIDDKPIDLKPVEMSLDILYEDNDLLVINKLQGLVVHPAPGTYDPTLVHGLLHYLGFDKNQFDNPSRPGIVHRLDKDTSGLIVVAKNPFVHRKLVEQFSHRQVKKIYLALTVGNPGNVTINAPIQRHRIKRQEMQINENGKTAITLVESIKHNHELALIKAHIITGRTHQVRVHLNHIGHPVVGDPIYGSHHINNKYNLKKQLLHSYEIGFVHPATGKDLFLRSPLPSWYYLVD